MEADILYQLLNPLVFTIFALGFFMIQKIRTDNCAAYIGASYIVGALAFLADIIFATSEDILIRTAIVALYALTTILIVGGCNLYYRKTMPWRLFGGMLLVHLVVYASLLAVGADWIRSMSANFGVGLMFLVGLFYIRKHLRRGLDKLLLIVATVNCAQCFLRPIILALMAGGTLDNATHSESMFVMTLHLFMAVSAVSTAMSLFLVLGRDIVEELQTRSDTDPLTSLFNRRGFEANAERILKRSKDQPTVVIVADIDEFKQVNDTYGHASGDNVIKTIGRQMRDAGPDNALTARFGGEEFVMLLPGLEIIEARAIAEKMRTEFAKTRIPFEGDPIECTASFGIAQYRNGESIDTLVARADKALYLAKNSGRNCSKCELDIAVYKLKKVHHALSHRGAPIDDTGLAGDFSETGLVG